jgi:hypothetical protein
MSMILWIETFHAPAFVTVLIEIRQERSDRAMEEKLEMPGARLIDFPSLLDSEYSRRVFSE